MTPKEEFISIYKENIKREGADKLLEYLEKSDFFTAPSSTRFHGSYEGGLVQHSLNVYHCLKDYLSRPRTKELYGMDYSGGSRECEFGGCVWQSADLLEDAVKNLTRCKKIVIQYEIIRNKVSILEYVYDIEYLFETNECSLIF